MQPSPEDFVALCRPSTYDLCPYLKEQDFESNPPVLYDDVLLELGIRYEREHLLTSPAVLIFEGYFLSDAYKQTTQVKDELGT